MFREDLLEGKRILITGGGTGLGKSMGRRYLELGAELMICGRRDAVLKETAAEFDAVHTVVALVDATRSDPLGEGSRGVDPPRDACRRPSARALGARDTRAGGDPGLAELRRG